MPLYRIHIPLQDFEGAKSERVYTCTRGAIYEAPEGEFKELARSEYSLVDTSRGPDDPSEEDDAEEDLSSSALTDDDSSSQDAN